MKPSTPSSTPSGSEVPWLIARACAGEWPYEPVWLDYLSHPALNKRFKRLYRMLVIPDRENRSVQVGMEVLRRRARVELANREVRHFEMKMQRQEGMRAVPHALCDEAGCDGCRGLGVTFVADKSSHVDTLGWVAVVRVVAS